MKTIAITVGVVICLPIMALVLEMFLVWLDKTFNDGGFRHPNDWGPK